MSQAQNNLSRRMFLKLMGTGVASAALAACVAAPAGQSPSNGKQWRKCPRSGGSHPQRHGVWRSRSASPRLIAEAFMARNGNIKVESVLPNDEQYYATLQTQYAGGSNPSLASMQGWGYQLFADNEVIAGVNDLRTREMPLTTPGQTAWQLANTPSATETPI